MKKNIYTKDELIEQIKEELNEELEGIKEYDKLYDSFKEHKMHDEADIIESIANDEYKHACALWDMLKDHDVDLSDHADIQSNWECVRDIFDV